MEELLGQIESNEFGLIGFLNSASDEEIVGALRKPAVKTALTKQLIAGKGRHGDSRAELINRLNQVDKSIARGLMNGTLQLVDTELFVARQVGAATNVKMLQDGDTKQFSLGTQIGMINGAKLEKGEVFMLTALQLLHGINATLKSTVFSQLEEAMRTGQFEMKANGKTLIPWTSLDVFMPNVSITKEDTTNKFGYAYVQGDTKKRIGYYELANPKLIKSQYAMEFNLEWANAATANTNLKVVLIGSRVFTH